MDRHTIVIGGCVVAVTALIVGAKMCMPPADQPLKEYMSKKLCRERLDADRRRWGLVVEDDDDEHDLFDLPEPDPQDAKAFSEGDRKALDAYLEQVQARCKEVARKAELCGTSDLACQMKLKEEVDALVIAGPAAPALKATSWQKAVGTPVVEALPLGGGRLAVLLEGDPRTVLVLDGKQELLRAEAHPLARLWRFGGELAFLGPDAGLRHVALTAPDQVHDAEAPADLGRIYWVAAEQGFIIAGDALYRIDWARVAESKTWAHLLVPYEPSGDEVGVALAADVVAIASGQTVKLVRREGDKVAAFSRELTDPVHSLAAAGGKLAVAAGRELRVLEVQDQQLEETLRLDADGELEELAARGDDLVARRPFGVSRWSLSQKGEAHPVYFPARGVGSLAGNGDLWSLCGESADMGLCRSSRDALVGWVPLHLQAAAATGVVAGDDAVAVWADEQVALVSLE